MNILIPMAGAGSRFKEAGYRKPKPLIDIEGKTMIRRVVEDIGLKGTYIFLVQSVQLLDKRIVKELQDIAPGSILLPVDGMTDGAACTCLLAEKLIQ